MSSDPLRRLALVVSLVLISACQSPTSPPRAWVGTWQAVRVNAQPMPFRTATGASYLQLDSVRLSLPSDGEGMYAERSTVVDADGARHAFACDVPMSVGSLSRNGDFAGALTLKIGVIADVTCRFSTSEMSVTFAVAKDTLRLPFRGYDLQFIRQ